MDGSYNKRTVLFSAIKTKERRRKAMKAKEMEYGAPKEEILLDGMYKGTRYVILSHGTHPTAYVATGKKIINTNDYCVHGGVTFTGKTPGIAKTISCPKDGTWIGWDYSHPGDQFAECIPGKRWTTAEIEKECKAVIDSFAFLI